jgi:hypothetical protein
MFGARKEYILKSVPYLSKTSLILGYCSGAQSSWSAVHMQIDLNFHLYKSVVCGLCNNTVSISKYVALDDRMINK